MQGAVLDAWQLGPYVPLVFGGFGPVSPGGRPCRQRPAPMLDSGDTVISMKLLRWCLFLAISWAASGVVQAQTIADAARQERERRKAVESATSKSIPVLTSVTPAPTATTSVKTATANETSKSTGPTDLQGHDEKYWRQKFDSARQAVKRAEDNLKLLDMRVNQTILTRGSSAIIALQKDAARKDLADAQQKIADLEDQLRRSGGLPGWSRPQ